MDEKEQVGKPKIIIQLWIDDENGVQFNAYYDGDMIDREQAGELSTFEGIIIHQVFVFLNTIEGIHKVFGYQKE